jgi:hypothetical protein
VFIIPGFVISLLTFPAVIVHETAHFLFCRVFRVAVFDLCYFRVGNPAGYVLHEKTERFTANWSITMGPFLVNTVLCAVFCTAAFVPVWELKIADPLAWFFYWLGLSIGMHAFPSTEDLKGLWSGMGEAAKRGNILAVLSYPMVGLLYVANYARVVWADLGYGILVGVLAPLALFEVLV